MNNLTIEQMREIVDGAPNGATHVEIIEDEASEYWLLDSETNLWHWHKDPSDPNRAWRIGIPELTVENIHSIENLRTIISQNEEIERLRNPWISVEDELPSIEGDRSRSVLIRRVYKNGTVSFTTSFLWSEAKKMSFSFNEPHWQTDIWNAQESNGYTVTHWMPLPQPPKGESDEC